MPLVFVSYSHKDQDHLTALLDALDHAGVERDLVWTDRDIDAGDKWRQRIDDAIDEARLAVVLVSPDLLASRFVNEHELPPLLTATERPRGALTLLCLHLAESEARSHPVRFFHPRDGRVREALLTDFQGLNDPFHPLDSQADEVRAEVLHRAANVIARLVRSRAARFDLTQTGARPAAATGLARVLGNPEVRAQAAAFGELFGTARDRIRRVADLKDLHDLLHTARIRCVEPIEAELANMVDPELSAEAVWEASLELVDTADAMSEWLESEAAEAGDRVWIPQFAKAAHKLQGELEQLKPGRGPSALRVLGRVLRTRLPAVNQRLLLAAKELPLAPLAAGLERVAASLAGVDSPGVNDLRDAQGKLAEVTQTLAEVSSTHDNWQQLDLQITVGGLEDLLEVDPEGGLEHWQSLGLPELIALCCDDPDDRAHQAIRQRADALATALERGELHRAPALLRRLRTRVAVHFYKVDVQLRRRCNELRALAAPIDGLLAWLKEG